MECERDMKGLTKRQEDVMNILWDAKEPIIASEIVKTGTDLNINTVQAALRSLIKKNYIEVAQIVYSGTVLTRSYRAIVKREEVPNETANEIRKALREEDVFARYIDEFDDSVLLAKLETIRKSKVRYGKKV